MVIAQLGKAIIACCEAHGRATDPFGERGGATRIGELLTRPRLGLATSSSPSARAHRAGLLLLSCSRERCPSTPR